MPKLISPAGGKRNYKGCSRLDSLQYRARGKHANIFLESAVRVRDKDPPQGRRERKCIRSWPQPYKTTSRELSGHMGSLWRECKE